MTRQQYACGLFVLALAAALTQVRPARSDAADKTRDPLKGEVDSKVAYVQTFDHKVRGGHCLIEAKVKFVKAGNYVVAGGYYKTKWMHESSLGRKYFESKAVKAGAGDVVTVKFRALSPPANKHVTVAVYANEKDIQTKS